MCCNFHIHSQTLVLLPNFACCRPYLCHNKFLQCVLHEQIVILIFLVYISVLIDQKQLENVESFKYLGSMLTNDGRCTREIKSRIAMAKAAFNKKMVLVTSTLDLKFRKKLVKRYIWSMALYCAETWTIRAVDQKHLESFEMWCWGRMEKISWTDHVRNEEVLL